eukprot:CAMPEP_0174858916 /NCGR_PEP_ID=MMETSP1114-20130205/44565_1 /TAXON_ID=312471 /ORGANISM="Neobodo designis, Strain CCAP 1951/1" /LENGTH=155 /DNA_ID=CAMNT_0016093841 /DNA_START=73 /DNA_END=540 /DNA_ORIENTATION=+
MAMQPLALSTLSKLCPNCGLSRQNWYCVQTCKPKAPVEASPSAPATKRVTRSAGTKATKAKAGAAPKMAKKSSVAATAGKKKPAPKAPTKAKPASSAAPKPDAMTIPELKAYLTKGKVPVTGLKTKAVLAKVANALRTGGLAAASTAVKRIKTGK